MTQQQSEPRVQTIHNHQKAMAASMGTNFVFYQREGGDGYEVYPLLGKTAVVIPGVATLAGYGMPAQPTSAIWTAQDLYFVGRDTAHVLLFDPAQSGKTVLTEVKRNGALQYEYPIRLDQYGAGHFAVPNVEPGEYVVSMKGTDKMVQFTAAKFTQAPLTAELVNQEKEGDVFTGLIGLKSYSTPLRKGIKVQAELRLEGQTVDRVEAEVDDNSNIFVQLVIPERDGRLTMILRVVGNADKIAQIALRAGKTAAERKATTINPLGDVTECAIFPMTGSTEVHGLHLRKTSVSNAPIAPKAVLCEQGTLVLKAPVTGLCISVFNPKTGRFDQHEYADELPAETEIGLPYNGAWCKVFIGGWVKGRDGWKPWEGFTTFLKPQKLSLQIETPQSVLPGQKFPINITVIGAKEEMPVFVTVRPSTYTAGTSGQSALALSLIQGFNSGPQFQVGPVSRTVAEVGNPPRAAGQAVRLRPAQTLGEELESGPEVLILRSGEQPPAMLSFPVSRGGEEPVSKGQAERVTRSSPAQPKGQPVAVTTKQAEQQIAFVSPREVNLPGLVHCGVHYVKNGYGQVMVTAPAAICGLTVEAFVAHSTDWAESKPVTINVTKDVWVEARLPAYVAPGDVVVAKADISTKSGQATAMVVINGAPAPFAINRVTWDNKPFASSETVEIAFAVKAGDQVQIIVDDLQGGKDTIYGAVQEMGKYTYNVRLPKFLEQGANLSTGGAIKEIEVLPGLKKIQLEVGALVRDSKVTPHDCCGQTADKMAVQLVLTLAGDTEARAAFFQAYQREKSMFVDYGGFKFYPHHDRPAGKENHYATHAAIVCNGLQVWSAHPMLKEDKDLAKAFADILKMGENALYIYKLPNMSSSNEPISNMRRAFEVAVMSGQPERVAAFVYNSITPAKIGKMVALQQHPAYQRADSCYAAIICARLGRYDLAYDLAQWVFSQFTKDGKPYGYIDLYPTVFMLGELQMNSVAKVRVNGMLEMTAAEAVSYSQQILSLEVLSGTVLVRVTEEREEDWNTWDSTKQVTVALQSPDANPVQDIFPGDKVVLVVTLDQYVPGDVCFINLPHALSLLDGGGLIKFIEADFKGEPTIRKELIATSSTSPSIDMSNPLPGEQRFVVGVRNMDDNSKYGTTGLNPVVVH